MYVFHAEREVPLTDFIHFVGQDVSIIRLTDRSKCVHQSWHIFITSKWSMAFHNLGIYIFTTGLVCFSFHCQSIVVLFTFFIPESNNINYNRLTDIDKVPPHPQMGESTLVPGLLKAAISMLISDWSVGR